MRRTASFAFGCLLSTGRCFGKIPCLGTKRFSSVDELPVAFGGGWSGGRGPGITALCGGRSAGSGCWVTVVFSHVGLDGWPLGKLSSNFVFLLGVGLVGSFTTGTGDSQAASALDSGAGRFPPIGADLKQDHVDMHDCIHCMNDMHEH